MHQTPPFVSPNAWRQSPQASHLRSTGPVLLVNSFDGREMYAEYLRFHRLDVSEASTPEIAFRQIAQPPPAVIITDRVFTVHGEYGRWAVVRSSGPSPAGVRVHVTHHAVGIRRQQHDRDDARATGVDVFLMKPCLPAQLLFEVRRVLSSRPLYNRS
jgi:PleD family two-component response regulator